MNSCFRRTIVIVIACAAFIFYSELQADNPVDSEKAAVKSADQSDALQQALLRADAAEAALQCYKNRDIIATACAVEYARLCSIGQEGLFPADYKNPELYTDKKVPACPSGGVYTYNAQTGTVTCAKHLD
jgi:hypothetical protein